MVERGSGGGVSLSEKAPWRGPPSLGTLEYMLRRSLGAVVSLHGGPFPHGGGSRRVGGGSYTGGFDR